ncbi:hypothetical protein J7F03_37290 [Streptomyces sp. ISL-43]|uniref:hypothetical protein n=1 Tax=Streptomyces sp. ISL-43 TaxID=2819183 RepID=UPI001BE9CE85|nr:hypothetical protein [Streptomyces sp. ISL-43]MBT2452601.1 hypothetical protein [Streptomyces sp. ISL-43]
MLRILLAWLGAQEPIRERDIVALTPFYRDFGASRIIRFLDSQGLLLPDETQARAPLNHPALSVPAAANPRIPRLEVERRDRHHERAIAAKLDALPSEMAEHMLTWVQVMRGEGRRRHHAVDYSRIRRNLRIVMPVLHAWAAAGLSLRAVTSDHVNSELTSRHGHQARGVDHVLLSVFRALKQQRIIFHNPMAGLSLTTPVRLPTPLPSDRLQGALDRVEGSRGKLVVALVAVHALKASEV